MRKETDLARVKMIAHVLLDMPIAQTPFSPAIVSHPFTSTGVTAAQNEDGNITVVDLLNNKEDYSRKYLAQHEAELAAYRAAKAAMNDLLSGAKLPKIDALKKERRELSEKKKALYAEYRKAQADMRQAVAVKANIDYLLGHTDGRENKAQER